MITVAVGEQAVLSIAQALFGHRGAAVGYSLRRSVVQPERLGNDALDLIEEILGVGWVMVLARRGGWRPWPHLRPEAVPPEGVRLWHRHPPPEVSFSGFAVDLCRWLASSPVADARRCQAFERRPETDGDELIAYLAVDLARANRLASQLVRQPGIRASFLVWLGFPQLLARVAPPDDLPTGSRLSAGAGLLFLEALNDELAARWVTAEWDKSRVREIDEMVALGAIQEAVMTATLAELERVDRRDLGRFFVAAAAELATAPPDLVAHLDLGVAISERVRGRRAAASFIRGLGGVRRWIEAARAVRFFEDEYDRAQTLLEMWELLGESRYRELCAVAGRLEAVEGGEP